MEEPKTDKQQAYEDGYSDGGLYCQTSMEQMQELTTKQIKEIDRLRKEREWLIDKIATDEMVYHGCTSMYDETVRIVLENMKQSLKDIE